MGVLDALMVTIPLMQEALNLDAQICLCDTEKTIGVWYAKSFRMDIPIGSYFDMNHPGDDMMIKAVETGEGSSGNLPDFIYGVPTNGILTPVKENGKVVGVISVAVSIANDTRINYELASVNQDLGNTQLGIDDIVGSAEHIATQLDELQMISARMDELVHSTAAIISVIQQNSKKSNIIALNATIEAARVGEEGRGFAVVAKEMGELAKLNNESTKTITKQIQEVIAAVNDMTKRFETIMDLAHTQVATTEEITAAVESITENTKELAVICKKNLK